MKMVRASIFVVLGSYCAYSAEARATEVDEDPVAPFVHSGDDAGWGLSTTLNVSSFGFDGSFSLLQAGVGAGASYKLESKKKRYPVEIGFYLAPTVAGGGDGGTTSAKVAFLMQVTFLKGFGLGLGYGFWQSGAGVVAPASSTIFFTLGAGLTNSK